jgi:hypothetical protein
MATIKVQKTPQSMKLAQAMSRLRIASFVVQGDEIVMTNSPTIKLPREVFNAAYGNDSLEWRAFALLREGVLTIDNDLLVVADERTDPDDLVVIHTRMPRSLRTNLCRAVETGGFASQAEYVRWSVERANEEIFAKARERVVAR